MPDRCDVIDEIKEILNTQFNCKNVDFSNSLILQRMSKCPTIKKLVYEHMSKFLSVDGLRFSNVFYLLYHNLHDHPKCPICGKSLKYTRFKTGYQTYCSLRCVGLSSDSKTKRKATVLKHYGVDNPLKSESVRKKSVSTLIHNHGVDNPSKLRSMPNSQYKDTCQKKYGMNGPPHTEEELSKISCNSLKQNFPFVTSSDRLRCECLPNFSIDDYKGVSHRYSWICTNCNQEFMDHLDNGHIPKCYHCHPLNPHVSNLEMEIVDFIKSLGVLAIENDRSILNGKELDIYIPYHKLAIEFDGLYWHSESMQQDRNYHLNKTLKCESKGIQLIHIFEDEWIEKKEIVKSIIRSKLAMNSQIYARSCEFSTVTHEEASEFLFDNHLQGVINGLSFGLFFKDELVSIITVGSPRFDKMHKIELLRFCNKKNFTIVGGLSKLIKNSGIDDIVVYCDLRHDDENVYTRGGFDKIGVTPPSYYYLKNAKRLNRVSFQKHLLESKLEIFDPNLTEWQNMQLNGYDRIWDCGNLVFSMK